MSDILSQTTVVIAIFSAGVFLGLLLGALLRIFQTNFQSTLKQQVEEKLTENRDSVLRSVGSQGDFIAHCVKGIEERVERMNGLVRDFEKDRSEKMGHLSARIEESMRQTSDLRNITQKLKDALSSTQSRGHLGEKIADDLLRIAGFIENVHYKRQFSPQGVTGRPDFTFLLPGNQMLFMDVKFPLSKFLTLQEFRDELVQRDRVKRDFLGDVRTCVRELAARSYGNIEKSLDYVILFIPSESVAAFIASEAPEVFEEALKQKIICVGPFGLFPVLTLVRQVASEFAIKETAEQVVHVLKDLKEQWKKFCEKQELIQGRFLSVQKEFEQLVGVRSQKVDRAFERIDALDLKADETQQSVRV